jgi:hypothetical protein
MPIPESQLKRWSHQGAVENAQRTHESIRAALKAYNWPMGVQYEVYLQGSYKNDTNIRGDSDVDVVVQLNSVFSSNRWGDAYLHRFAEWNEFKINVLNALRNRYEVGEGKKALKVITPYLRADVVVCIQYRKYPEYPRDENDFIEGMTFYVPSEERWVINYPKIHYKNGVEKNKKTGGWYKPTVRMFKNARTYLVDRGVIPDDLAPSYFLECLLYNVPNDKFGGSFQATFCNIINWLRNADLTQFVCQNEQLPLFGDSPEQWSVRKAQSFIRSMVDLWNNWR